MTIILAKLLGIYLFAIGCALLISPDRFRKAIRQIATDENFLFLGGVLALLIGAFIISVHNEWTWGWPLIITVLGWWSLIKGFVLLIYPDSVRLLSFIQEKTNTFYRFVSLIYALLGLFLIGKAWSLF